LVLAIPKPVADRLRFDPLLPPAYDQWLQRQPTGSTLKIQAVYSTPFWREDNLNGSVISDTGPIEIVYDNSPPSGKPGVLVGFAEGDRSRELYGVSAARRRSAVLASLVRYFGNRAGSPVAYADKMWALERFTRGAYGSYNPPGVLTSLGAATDGPVGPIHFAGADFSPQWPGYMEGAIRSGENTASAILAGYV
jgi:monoamine oxidase